MFSGLVEGTQTRDQTRVSINEICDNEGLTKIFATPDQILITPMLFLFTLQVNIKCSKQNSLV
jgi:hypothetical protein